MRTVAARAPNYGAYGLRVIAVAANGKRPLERNWPEAATANLDVVDRWLADGKNLGAVMGARSAPFADFVFAVDVDVHDIDGEKSLAELEARHGALPPTWEAVTGGGGRHLIFRSTSSVRNAKLAPGVDIRGEGGQIVVFPSVHPSGEKYRWRVGHAPWQHDIADAPGWLLAMLVDDKPANMLVDDKPANMLVDDKPAKMLDDGTPAESRALPAPVVGDRPGDRWAAVTSWAEILTRDGWSPAGTGPQGEERWTRPGKDRRDGCSATTGWAGSDVLKVFTSSVPSLQAEATYTKLGYVAATRFGGDHSAAARELADLGFGSAESGTPDLSWIDEGQASGACNLSPEFWAARPMLEQIRTAAHARTRSADAVLGAVLARIAACTPPTVRLPAPVGVEGSLNVIHVLVGASGSGKSSGAEVARRLLAIDDPDIAEVPLGSGEGLVEIFLDWANEVDAEGNKRKVKRQVRRRALVTLDEGQALIDMSSRQGNTLLPTLRTAWSGGTLGQANASEERKRLLPAHEYRVACLVGFQHSHAVPLIEDAPAGTPQRCTFFSALDPSIPDDAPDWPGPLDWRPLQHRLGAMGLDPGIAAAIRGRALAVSRGELELDDLDSHKDLLTLKVAGLLAILDARTTITAQDWELASMVNDCSTSIRSAIVATGRAERQRIEDARTQAQIRANRVIGDADTERAIESMARAVANHVSRHEVECSRACVTRATAGKHRAVASVDDALALAEDRGWIERFEGAIVLGKTSL